MRLAYKFIWLFVTVITKLANMRIVTENFDRMTGPGDIYVFNHFTRLEALLPQYILYCLNPDILCFTIAWSGLFKVPVIGWIMKKSGAVPHDHPNLMPLLTSKILDGYKIVIFPQGEMVKNHDTIDMKTGTAVIALGTDLYKRCLRENKGLKLTHKEIEFSCSPTIVVPCNISYYPLRDDPNVLTCWGKRAGLSSDSIEELTVEGNILLKDTDMIMKFAEPITIDSTHISVKGLRTIEECYEALRIDRQTRFDIRDQYNDLIYQNLQINLGHIFSEVLFQLWGMGIRSVSRHQLKYAVRESCENLDMEFDIEDYVRMLELAKKQKVMSKDKFMFVLSHRLVEEKPFNYIRISNLFRVYYNEFSPMIAEREIIKKSISGSRFESKMGFVLQPKKSNGKAILLIHGLFGTANQTRNLAEKFQADGYVVHSPLIAGHGVTEECLAKCTHHDWVESIDYCKPNIPYHIIGFSTGGLIAAHIADTDHNVLSMTTICAPLTFVQKNIRFTKLLNFVRYPRFLDNSEDKETCDRMPVRTLCELLDLVEDTKEVFKRIEVATMIIQHVFDPIVDPDSGYEISKLIPHAELEYVDSQGHNMDDSQDLLFKFIGTNI